MGCGCKERGKALSKAAVAASRGDMRTASKSLHYVGSSFARDARNGSLRDAAMQKLAALKHARR